MSEESDQAAPAIGFNQSDWFLRSLVNIVNESQIKFGITLQIGGMLVTGQLVSGKQYFEGFAAEFSSAFARAFSEGSAAEVRESFASHGAIYGSQAEGEEPPFPRYIHLKEARFVLNRTTQLPTARGVWWRGRLSEVAGFHLGTLSPEG